MSKSKSKTMSVFNRIDTGISRENLQKITNILNDNLSDEYVLLTKTRNYHWNVEIQDLMISTSFLKNNMN